MRGNQDVDSIRDFLAGHTRERSGVRVLAIDIYRAYLAWAQATGRHWVSAKWLAMRMHSLGYYSIKSNRMYWLGLELVDVAPPNLPKMGGSE